MSLLLSYDAKAITTRADVLELFSIARLNVQRAVEDFGILIAS